MLNENTLLIGQVLQIRDKLVAKRHAIPKSLLAEWKELNSLTAEFDLSQNTVIVQGGSLGTKPTTFKGSANELMKLVEALKVFDKKLKQSVQYHH